MISAVAAIAKTMNFMKLNVLLAAKKFILMTKCSMKSSLNVPLAAKSLNLISNSTIATAVAIAAIATKNN
jgi:hypothetical protein